MEIFIVDDSEILRGRIIELLSDIPGVNIVGESESVQDAVDQIGLTRPDLIILDIRIPGGSGFDVLKRVKELEPAPLVIMLSNCPVNPYREISLSEGADYFFGKTLELDKIPETVSSLVQAKA